VDAARVVELAEVLFGQDLEPQLLRRLALAKSNIADQRDGARIYEKMKKALGHPDVDVAISKEDYRLCEGLGQLHSVIRQNPLDFVKNVHWPRPQLEEAGSILERVANAKYVEAEAAFSRDRAENGSLLGFLRDMKIPLPTTSASTAERALNSMLRRALTEDNLDEHRIRTLVEEARALGVKLDVLTIQCIEKTVAHLSKRCSAAPENIERLAALNQHIELLSSLGLSLTLWTMQNMCYSFVQSIYPAMKSKCEAGDRSCQAWICQFRMLGEKLALRVPG
jgi:hypothetical protein